MFQMSDDDLLHSSCSSTVGLCSYTVAATEVATVVEYKLENETNTVLTVWVALNITKRFSPSIKLPVLIGYDSLFVYSVRQYNPFADSKLHPRNTCVCD